MAPDSGPLESAPHSYVADEHAIHASLSTTALLGLSLLLTACGDKGGPSESDSGDGGGNSDSDGVGFDAREDCDDGDAAVYPGAAERCDGLDNDCDEEVDEDAIDAPTWYADADADGFGDASVTMSDCDVAEGFVADGTDCDDDDPAINPGATEVCDADDVDEDCDTLSDDADSGVDTSTFTTFYTDADADTYGDPLTGADSCDPGATQVADATDCDDDDPAVNPGETEVCDADDVDEDCDTLSDDADSGVDTSTFTTFYTDADADTYGDPLTGADSCDPGATQVTDATDCDDDEPAVNPAATEVPQDGVDDDCDGIDAPYAVTDLLVGDLVITEVMQNPDAVADGDGEWFEVWNNSGGDIDLDGLYVYDVTSTGAVSTDFTVTGPLVFSDDEYIVFGRSDDTATNGGVSVDHAFGTAMALVNGSDELILTDGGSGGTQLDIVQWDNGATFPDPSGASMSLCPNAEDNNDDGSLWRLPVTAFGAGDLGTPGSENDSCIESIGYDSEFSGATTNNPNYLVGVKVTVPSAGTLDGFGIIFKGGSAQYKMMLYTDRGGSPDALVAETGALSYSTPGVVEPDVTDVALAAGDYWVMAVFDSVASVGVSYTGSFQFRELTFGGGTPDPFGAATTVSGQTFNFYINVY